MSKSPDSKSKTKPETSFATRAPRMTILSDHPILREDEEKKRRENDSFELHTRLGAIYDIIRHKNTRAPLAIALYGDWGAGKSSSMRWLIDQLDQWNRHGKHNGHYKVRTVWFDPWKYDSREEVWRGLIAEVIIKAIDVKGASLATVTKAATDFGFFLGRSFINVLSRIELKIGAKPPGNGAKAEAKVDLESLTKIAEDYRQTAHPEKAYLNEFESTLKTWVADSLGKDERMAIFIDDLDRCLPNVMLEVLEALKLYLNIPQLIFVIGLDRQVVDAVVKKEYRNQGLSESKAEHYLDKMFQVEMRIAPSQKQMEDYLLRQIDALDAATDRYWAKNLNGWDEKYRKIIQEKISALADNNPREIKRLLNSTLLRGSAAARMDGDDKEEAQRFTQGCQVYLIDKVLEKFVPESHGLLLRTDAQKFFKQWSRFVRDYPDYKSAALRTDEPESPEKTGGKRPAAPDESITKADAAYKKLREAAPRYHDTNEPVPLFTGKHLRHLWGLLTIPFSADVAAAGVLERLDDEDEEPPTTTPPETPEGPLPPDTTLPDRRTAAPRLADMPRVLLSAVAQSMNKSVKELRPNDLANVRELDLSRSALTDLTPLATLENLQRLGLASTQVSDLTPLATLENLQRLDLAGTRVSDLTPLAKLGNLQWLGLASTQVSDLTPLAKLENLRELSLAETRVSDLTPLEKLTNLRTLDFFGAQLSDLTPLEKLENLQALWLGATQSSTLRPLAKLANLRELHLIGTEVSDFTPLAELRNLRELELTGTEISDLTPLEQLENLQALALGGTQVSDLAPLAKLGNLQWLDLAGTQVSDLTPLATLGNLQRLDLNGTEVSDLTPLAKLKNLQELDLRDTQVSDLTTLTKLGNLETLWLADTQVSDAAVAELKKALPGLNIIR